MNLENFIKIIDEIDPDLIIYQIGNPSFDSEIYLFSEEESGQKTEFWKDNVKYVYLFVVVPVVVVLIVLIYCKRDISLSPASFSGFLV